MKLFVFIFIWYITLFSAGCLFTDKGKPETNINGQANSNFRKGNDSIEKPPNNLTENDIKESIQEYAGKIGLVSLTKASQSNEFELRLWINLGMPGDTKLFIVRTGGSRQMAYFYQFIKPQDTPEQNPKQVLTDPKNGWSNLQSEITNRLITPNQLTLDPKFRISRHEGMICLEVAQKGKYQFVYYGHHSSFDDAVRLINLCGFLSKEFSVNMDCRGERTNLGPIE